MEAQQLWQAVLGDLEVRLSKTAFNNWLRPTRVVAFHDDTVTVAAANTFGAATLQGRYASQIERAVSDLVGRPIKVEFTITERSDTGRQPEPAAPLRRQRHLRTPRALSGNDLDRPNPANPHAIDTGTANPAASTEPSRRAAISTTRTVGKPPTMASIRVMSMSRTSSGPRTGSPTPPRCRWRSIPAAPTTPSSSTAVSAWARPIWSTRSATAPSQLRPDLQIIYVSSEKFTNDLINAIRGQRMEEFRSRYRAADILMIDDIQFIAGKESTQEEFFHTFNALYQAGKQVVITSDRSPRAIASLADRLRSRFEGGLIADVGLPDFETRTAILRTKGESMGIALPDAVVEYVAEKDQTNIRELEGALNRILALSQLTGRSLTLSLAMEALTGAGGGAGGPRPKASADAVVEAVAAYYKVHLKRCSWPGPHQRDRAPPPGGDVPDSRGDRPLPRRHRQGTGWPRPHHRHARHREDRAGPLRRRVPPLPGHRPSAKRFSPRRNQSNWNLTRIASPRLFGSARANPGPTLGRRPRAASQRCFHLAELIPFFHIRRY